jgi:hypothetical protein
MRCFLLLFVVLSLASLARAENISALGARPDWKRLDGFQRTITKDEFTQLLDKVYAPGGAANGQVIVKDTFADIRKSGDDWFRLEFAATPESRKPTPRYWKPPVPGSTTAREPLKGIHVALDPGHIGGDFAKMEERWFQIGADRPIMEGEMTLIVARLLEARLRSLGAKVTYVRRAAKPVTPFRPEDLKKVAQAELRKQGIANPPATYPPRAPGRTKTIQGYSELLFYRTAEISARADLVNDRLKPDVVIALHFNAEDWGDPDKPRLTNITHLHLLVNGKYGADELKYDDQRFEMLLKLLNRSYQAEVSWSKPVAAALARDTGLPPYTYMGGNASAVAGQPYIWKRNLRANRLYECPVIFTEPYIMNCRADYIRMQMGDYTGLKSVEGRMRKSIYREYADAVADGLAAAVRTAP